jgi:equilibrative nucleoside transporter 1/2/3
MFFPVFTSKILSVNDGPDANMLFHPAAFIALAFFFWNIGDLGGRLATALPFSLGDRPALLFLLSVLRAAYIPLYLLCNIGGRGAIVSSDAFYLIIVQLIFGMTNGWLGASYMMAAGGYVEDEERAAAGGFMGLCLVIGLTTGSFLSFTVAGV